MIKLNQKAWLKPYFYTNTKLRTKEKNIFFFKFINNSVFGKTMGNVRKHRDIRTVTTDKRKSYLVSELNWHKAKRFSKILLEIEMNKKEWKEINQSIKVQKSANKWYLGFAMIILNQSMMIKWIFVTWIQIYLQ